MIEAITFRAGLTATLILPAKVFLRLFIVPRSSGAHMMLAISRASWTQKRAAPNRRRGIGMSPPKAARRCSTARTMSSAGRDLPKRARKQPRLSCHVPRLPLRHLPLSHLLLSLPVLSLEHALPSVRTGWGDAAASNNDPQENEQVARSPRRR